MVRPGRGRLTEVVEVDETDMGGLEPGRSGRGALAKTLVAIAVEQRGRGIGRCRMQPIPDAKAASLREFRSPTSRPARSSSATAGAATHPPARRTTTIAPSRSARPSFRRTSCSRAAIASRRWPSAGCWEPTRAPSSPRTCGRT